MCLSIAAASVDAWLASQERMLRALRDDAALDPCADASALSLLDDHCAWLARHRQRWANARPAPEQIERG